MAVKDFSTNLFTRDANRSTNGTIATNGRARLEQTNDGRIYVVIDGIKYSANKYDLFGMNDNPTQWLETFVKEYDKETKKDEFNTPQQTQINNIKAKMAENTKKIKESRTIQERIKEAMKHANIALSNFLKECGVHLKSSLSGENKVKADKINNDYWAKRFALTSENNKEFSLLSYNQALAYDEGKAERQIAFNNIILERT